MKFGYTILYVDDLAATVSFYQQAFGLKGEVIAPDQYAELDTGATKLAFAPTRAVQAMIELPLQPGGLSHAAPPVEIGLVTDDVPAAYERAVAAGATPVKPPAAKPWGQVVGYVRDNNGFLVELCTPMG